MTESLDEPRVGDPGYELNNLDFTITGDIDKFDAAITDVCLASDTLRNIAKIIVCARKDLGGDPAHVLLCSNSDGCEDDVDLPPLEREIFFYLLERFDPKGHEWEFNDGPYDRLTSYSCYPHKYEISVTRKNPSATLRAVAAAKQLPTIKKARLRVLEWLDKNHPSVATSARAQWKITQS